MLILFGLLQTRRFHAGMALLGGIFLLTWAQHRLVPPGKPTLDPKQAVASAWTHQLPLVVFGFDAEAAKRIEAEAKEHADAHPYAATAQLGGSGEAWGALLGPGLARGER